MAGSDSEAQEELRRNREEMLARSEQEATEIFRRNKAEMDPILHDLLHELEMRAVQLDDYGDTMGERDENQSRRAQIADDIRSLENETADRLIRTLADLRVVPGPLGQYRYEQEVERVRQAHMAEMSNVRVEIGEIKKVRHAAQMQMKFKNLRDNTEDDWQSNYADKKQ